MPIKEMTLDALIEFAKTCPPLPKKSATSPKPPKVVKRLAWKVYAYDKDKMSCEPFVQTYSDAEKTWDSGTRLSPKELYENQFVYPFLSAQDRAICSKINVFGSIANRFVYELPGDIAYELIGHPSLVVDNPSHERVEFVKGNAGFSLEKNGKNVILKFRPEVEKLADNDGKVRTLFVVHDFENVYKVVKLSELEQFVLQYYLEFGNEYTPDGFEKPNELLSILSGRVDINADGLK